nr:phage tail tip lysozyme [Enterococcus faecalis]
MGRTELAFYGRSANLWGRFPNILHRGLGLGQWTDTADGGRRHTLLLDYAKGKNKKWYDLQLQLDFIFDGDAPGSRTAADNVARSKVLQLFQNLLLIF